MNSRRWRRLLILASTATFAASAADAAVHVSGATDTLTVAPGAVFTVDIVIPQADALFNAFSLGLRFDPTRLAFVAASPNKDVQRGSVMLNACSNTFHVFSATPDSLKVELSLLCNQVSVAGPGVIYRVKFQAGLNDAITSITFGPSTRFLLGGAAQTPLVKSPIVLRIGNPLLGVEEDGYAKSGVEFLAPSPNPARSDVPMGLRFALARREQVSFDLLDASGRRIAARAPQAYEAGAAALIWNLGAVAPGRYSVLLRTASGSRRIRAWTVLR